VHIQETATSAESVVWFEYNQYRGARNHSREGSILARLSTQEVLNQTVYDLEVEYNDQVDDPWDVWTRKRATRTAVS
jgi:hypothetical protein